MRALAVIGSLVLGTGCFYIDPINQRPGIAIRQLPLDSTDGQVHRGEPHLRLFADVDDPEGHDVTVHWELDLCADGLVPETCDTTALLLSDGRDVDVAVPTKREGGEPVESLRITLDADDAYGAGARPQQVLVLPVLDALPDVVVDDQSAYGNVVGTPIDLFAVYGDADDTAAGVTVTWKAFSPTPADTTLVDISAPPPEDETKAQVGVRLVPEVPGAWMIEVHAMDIAGFETVVVHPLVVELDGPPCLEQWSPIAPTGGAALPVDEPTLFQVPLVFDALDPFPTIPDDPLRQPARFEWSIKPPGGSREVLVGATGNSIAFDPAAFTVGDLVELRVEVFDRNDVAVTCADAQQTCAVVATDPGCIQRQTWLVEVR